MNPSSKDSTIQRLEEELRQKTRELEEANRKLIAAGASTLLSRSVQSDKAQSDFEEEDDDVGIEEDTDEEEGEESYHSDDSEEVEKEENEDSGSGSGSEESGKKGEPDETGGETDEEIVQARILTKEKMALCSAAGKLMESVAVNESDSAEEPNPNNLDLLRSAGRLVEVVTTSTSPEKISESIGCLLDGVAKIHEASTDSEAPKENEVGTEPTKDTEPRLDEDKTANEGAGVGEKCEGEGEGEASQTNEDKLVTEAGEDTIANERANVEEKCEGEVEASLANEDKLVTEGSQDESEGDSEKTDEEDLVEDENTSTPQFNEASQGVHDAMATDATILPPNTKRTRKQKQREPGFVTPPSTTPRPKKRKKNAQKVSKKTD